jgi:hypothetical protein
MDKIFEHIITALKVAFSFNTPLTATAILGWFYALLLFVKALGVGAIIWRIVKFARGGRKKTHE